MQLKNFVYKPESKGLNIQGNYQTSASNNGRYVIIRTSPVTCVLLIDTQPPQEYHDNYGRTIQSITVSDNGLIVIGLNSAKSSIVRIFNGSLKKSVFDEPWQLHFGNGLSITPTGKYLAIGSPGENKVYLYALNDTQENRGPIIKSSKKVIIRPGSESFGWKVGLSKSGTSVAIAAPSKKVESLDVGVIYIYILVEDEWRVLDTVLYGSANSLRIGIGGVSIDDNIGIISVQDNTLDHKQNFMVSFNIAHRLTIPISKLNNNILSKFCFSKTSVSCSL